MAISSNSPLPNFPAGISRQMWKNLTLTLKNFQPMRLFLSQSKVLMLSKLPSNNIFKYIIKILMRIISNKDWKNLAGKIAQSLTVSGLFGDILCVCVYIYMLSGDVTWHE